MSKTIKVIKTNFDFPDILCDIFTSNYLDEEPFDRYCEVHPKQELKSYYEKCNKGLQNEFELYKKVDVEQEPGNELACEIRHQM